MIIMRAEEIKEMRRKQFMMLNIVIILIMYVVFLLIMLADMTYASLYFLLGVVAFMNGLIGLLKKESTKYLLLIFEKVATYEKKKMGKEWEKQRRLSYFMNISLSIIMFFQVYLHRNSIDKVLQLDWPILLLVTIWILAVVNIGLFFHVRNVDCSSPNLWYTRKKNLFIISIGIFFVILTVSSFIIYIYAL
ncbi:hypothetical protein [Fictibacillus phosphorivorans]|nr:hypothetical protein [Fictibacillus phosphorivorans]